MPTTVLIYGSVLCRLTTYPLINLEHRQLSLLTGTGLVNWRSEELGLMNNVQSINTSPTSAVFSWRSCSYTANALVLYTSPITLQYTESVTKNRLMTLKHASNTISLQDTIGNIHYVQLKPNKLKELAYISSSLIETLVETQSFTFGLGILHTHITTLKHRSSQIDCVINDQSVEFTTVTGKKFKASTVNAYSSALVKQLNVTSRLNYGSGNTFYSLNGFYAYFKLAHIDLLDTSYHILIGKKLINMYDENMTCVESHRAGYKRIPVGQTFLQDNSGEWRNYSSIPHIFYEDKLALYDESTKRLCTYDFDSITFEVKKYFSLDSVELPSKVCLCLDQVYGVPYIMPKSDESTQRKTQPGEYWNFLQIDNLKLIPNTDTIEAADIAYLPELFIPTGLTVETIVFRFEDTFILLGSRGLVEKEIYAVDINAPSIIKTIAAYHGSGVIYTEYPYIYYSKYAETFTTNGVYAELVKLNLETLDSTSIELEHTNYHIVKNNNHLWHLYKKFSDGHYYIYKEDLPGKVINITKYLGLIDKEVIQFSVFNTYTVYLLTSDRLILEFNIETMQYVQHDTIGVPILLLKFNSEYGCVLTRLGTDMFFEELMPIEWSQNPDDWITPVDMRKGELLLPYTVYTGAMFERLAPITTVKDCVFTEYLSNQLIAIEIGVVDALVKPGTKNSLYPVKVGRTEQIIVGNAQHAVINPIEQSVGLGQYAASLKTNVNLHTNGVFEIGIEALPFPEEITVGFKVYEK